MDSKKLFLEGISPDSIVQKLFLFDFDGTLAFTGEELDENRLVSPVENAEITQKLKDLINQGENVGVLTARKNEGLVRKYLYHIGIFSEELNIYAVDSAESEAKGNYILDNFGDYDVVVLYDNRSDCLVSATGILKDSGIEFVPVLVSDHRKISPSVVSNYLKVAASGIFGLILVSPELLQDINNSEWFTGNRGMGHPLSGFPVYLSSSLVVATLFAEAGKYVMEVDGEDFMCIDEDEARFIVDAVDPIYTPSEIVNWKSDLLDPDNVGEDIVKSVSEALTYYGLEGVASFRLLLKEEEISGVFVAKVDLKNVKVVDYSGRVWGTEDTFLDQDARQAKEEGYDGFLGKNIREGGIVFQEDFPIGDTLVLFDSSSIVSFGKKPD